MKRMLRKRIKLTSLIFSIMFIIILSACSNSDEGKDKVISIGTHPVGIAYHSAGTGVAKVVSENSSLKMIVSPFTGGTAWTPLLNEGEIDVGITAKPATEWAFDGDFDYKYPNRNMRLLVKGNDIIVSGLTVLEKSGIESLKDLKGKKIASGYSGDAIVPLIGEAQLKSVGLTLDDVELIPVADVGQGLDALREGRVDAAFTGSPTVASFLEIDNAVGLRVLDFADLGPEEMDEIPEELLEEIQSLVPGIEPVVFQGGFLEEEKILLKYPITLVVSADLSDENAYEVTETLFENYEELHPIFAWLKTWSPESMVDADPLVPYHNGTVQYLKDNDLWTDEIDEKQKELMKETEK